MKGEQDPLLVYEFHIISFTDNCDYLFSIQWFIYRRAPPSILNVQTNQPVELRVARRLHEDYIPPSGSSSSAAFSGSGHRLGAPTPEIAGSGSVSAASSSSMPGSFPTSNNTGNSGGAESRTSLTTRFEVDQSLPTTSVQIRLADGTRWV
jgi:UBX domain-containing protein 1